MSEQPWTIGRLLTWTTDYLRDQGAESPRLDAELLLAEARQCKRIELYTAFGEQADERVRVAFREMVRRRAEGTPVAYLLGHQEFFSLSFRVTPDVLIPRPETELIVVELLDAVKNLPPATDLHIADVGTGSGILAVCAARHLPDAQVTAIDISSPALEIAQANADKHQVADQIQFVEGDLLTTLPEQSTFDFILSNPPYVCESEIPELPEDVREHEPRVALSAGEDGCAVISRLIPQAAARLKPGGQLIMEISPMIAERVTQLVDDEPSLGDPRLIKDIERRDRVVVTQRK